MSHYYAGRHHWGQRGNRGRKDCPLIQPTSGSFLKNYAKLSIESPVAHRLLLLFPDRSPLLLLSDTLLDGTSVYVYLSGFGL